MMAFINHSMTCFPTKKTNDVLDQTLVVCETNVACLQEANYANARQFRPERWMNGSKISNAFLNLPFGVGRRMCPGKRIAEHEMMVLTAKVRLEKHLLENTKGN